MQMFSTEWITAFGEALRHSEPYKQQAQTWEGIILLVLNEADSSKNRAVWLDLWHGECRDIKEANPLDIDAADYVLIANRSDWQQILNKEIAPMMAIMRGKLKLQKGSIATLARYANAAKELVYVAADIPAEWD